MTGCVLVFFKVCSVTKLSCRFVIISSIFIYWVAFVTAFIACWVIVCALFIKWVCWHPPTDAPPTLIIQTVSAPTLAASI